MCSSKGCNASGNYHKEKGKKRKCNMQVEPKDQKHINQPSMVMHRHKDDIGINQLLLALCRDLIK
jgi:hypothetical protein